MKEKKMSLFWKIYLLAVSLFGVLLIAGVILLFAYLSAFEKSQPIHPAREIFEEYFASGDFEKALKKAEFSVGDKEEISHAAEAMESLCKDKKIEFYAVGVEKGVAKYNVITSDGEKSDSFIKIGTILLKKEKEEDLFGFSSYQFDDMEIFLKPSFSASVKIPSDFGLTVNGIQVKKEEAKNVSSHTWNDYLPKESKKLLLAEFTFSDLFCEPEIAVYNEKGEAVSLVMNEESGFLEAPIQYEEVPKELSDRLLTGMKEYAKFIQADGSTAALGEYFDRSSLFYQNTARNPGWWVTDHDGFTFEKEKVENFYFFDENTLCCHISFDQVLKTRGKEDYIDPVDMTVFARKIGGSWYIFDRIVL